MSASFRITIGFMLRSNLQFLHNFRCRQLFSRRCKMSATVEALTNDILDFWFLPSDNEGFGKMRFAWFKKDEAFDQLICSKYLYLIESAIAGDLKAEWNSNPRSALAHLLLLDQFTRNIFRGTPKAFAGDSVAVECAKYIVATGMDLQLLPIHRPFVYLPFEHSELLADQQESVRLSGVLASEHESMAPFLKYAQNHHDDIVKFGRFPHRNAILGRESTADELTYLQQGGGY